MYTLNRIPELTGPHIEHLRDCIEIYGEDAEIDLCIEEMSELTKALCKYKRLTKNGMAIDINKKEVLENIKEEIADVYLTINQMDILFVDGDELRDIIAQKIERNIKRIEKDRIKRRTA